MTFGFAENYEENIELWHSDIITQEMSSNFNTIIQFVYNIKFDYNTLFISFQDISVKIGQD